MPKLVPRVESQTYNDSRLERPGADQRELINNSAQENETITLDTSHGVQDPQDVADPSTVNAAANSVESVNTKEESDTNEESAPLPLGSANSKPPSSLSFSSHGSGSDVTERRVNPKDTLTRNKRPCQKEDEFASAAAQNVAKRLSYKPIAQLVDNTHLFRLCESVPYILGPKLYLDALVRAVDYPILPDGTLDDYGFTEQDRLGPADMALITILILLRLPEAHRKGAPDYVLLGTQTQGNSLVVWKDVGPFEPQVMGLTVGEFAALYIEWGLYPNPALCANNRPDVQTPWSEIVEMFHYRHIDVRPIDSDLYFKLTRTPVGDMLYQELEKAQQAAESSELPETRNQCERTKHMSRGAIAHHRNSFSYVQPMSRDRTQLYSVRFSHEYPQGKLHDPKDDANHIDEHFANYATTTRRKPKLEQGIAVLKAKKREWSRTRCGKWTKTTVILMFVCAVLATLLLLLYFKIVATDRNKF